MKILNSELLNKVQKESSPSLSLTGIVDDIISNDKKLKSLIMRANPGDDLLYSTGFDMLDYRNGQKVLFKDTATGVEKALDVVGLNGGSMHMLIGKTNVGKSTIAAQIGYNIVKDYPLSSVFYFDIEKGFSDTRFMQLTGINAEECEKKFRRYTGRISTESLLKMIAQHSEMIEKHREEFEIDTGVVDALGRPVKIVQPSVYIIDSVRTLSSSTVVTDEIEGSTSGGRIAKELTQFLIKVQPLITKANIIILFINHISSKMSVGTPTTAETIYGLKQDESIAGGHALKYLCSTILRFDTKGAWKVTTGEGYSFNGHFTQATIIKTRTNQAGSSVMLAFEQGRGFMNYMSKFYNLVEAGIVTGTQRRTLPGYPKSVWLKEVKDLIETDELFRECIDKAVEPLLDSMLSDSTKSHLINQTEYEELALAEIEEAMKED